MANTWTDYGIRQVMLNAFISDHVAPTSMDVRLLSAIPASPEEIEDFTGVTEVANGNGYTTGGIALDITAAGGSDWTVSEPGTDGVQVNALANKQWTASGGSLAAAGAAIVVDQAGTDKVWAIFDFGGTVTVTDGGTLTMTGCELRITTA